MSVLADLDAAAVLRLLAPGKRVFLHGSTGGVPALTVALCAEGAPPLDVTASFVPAVNPDPTGALPPGSRLRNLFALGPRGGQAGGAHEPSADVLRGLRRPSPEGRVRRLRRPCRAARRARPRLARRRGGVHAARPAPRAPGDRGGQPPGAADGGRREPRAVGGRARPGGRCAPARVQGRAPTAQSDAIAANIAGSMDDGAVLQNGLGKVPDALVRRLADRRGLRLWSGMLSDAVRGLLEAGALDPAWRHASCVHVGRRAHYEWRRERRDFAVRACTQTHGAAALARLDGLVAVNGALSVDLFGQANLETLGGHDVEVVATEHGAADLRGAFATERAERLIAVAAPEHRGALSDAWREIAARL